MFRDKIEKINLAKCENIDFSKLYDMPIGASITIGPFKFDVIGNEAYNKPEKVVAMSVLDRHYSFEDDYFELVRSHTTYDLYVAWTCFRWGIIFSNQYDVQYNEENNKEINEDA